MESRNNTNKKAGRYDNAIITLAEENPQLDLVQLSTVFENLGGSVEGQTPNLVRIMNIEWVRNLLHNNRNDEAEKDENEGTTIITLNQLEVFFYDIVDSNIKVFEEIMNNRAIRILLGFNGEIPSIELTDLSSFFQESLKGDIVVFRRIMTDDIMRLLTDDLDNPIIALGDLGNFFHNSLDGNIEAFETVVNTPGITELLGANQGNIVQITITELGNYCKQAIENNILEQALNNVQIAEDPVQQILGEVGVPIANQEDQPMGEGNNSEDEVMLE
jgi:hypothetical protein